MVCAHVLRDPFLTCHVPEHKVPPPLTQSLGLNDLIVSVRVCPQVSVRVRVCGVERERMVVGQVVVCGQVAVVAVSKVETREARESEKKNIYIQKHTVSPPPVLGRISLAAHTFPPTHHPRCCHHHHLLELECWVEHKRELPAKLCELAEVQHPTALLVDAPQSLDNGE